METNPAANIEQHFGNLEDPRVERTREHKLLDILVVAICAVSSLNNLGALLQAQGDYAAALPYYERALTIFEERLGTSHSYTKTVRRNLIALQWVVQQNR